MTEGLIELKQQFCYFSEVSNIIFVVGYYEIQQAFNKLLVFTSFDDFFVEVLQQLVVFLQIGNVEALMYYFPFVVEVGIKRLKAIEAYH